MSGGIRFRPVAERAVLAEFGDRICEDTSARVLALDRALAAAPFPGFVEATPAYVNILVEFDPLVTDHAAVAQALSALAHRGGAEAGAPAVREVLVCYDADLAPDLAQVAERTGLDPEAVIAAHLSGDFRVYLYGFAPGYAYMAGLPAVLDLPRKDQAVRDVPAGTVVIAGSQCIVSTLKMPTGWWRIGRSPTRILDTGAGATGDRPFLFDVGDHVRFRRIDRAEYDRMTEAGA